MVLDGRCERLDNVNIFFADTLAELNPQIVVVKSLEKGLAERDSEMITNIIGEGNV
jgi:hypothetical protein